MLNASFEPLCVVPVRRAVVLVLKEKAIGKGDMRHHAPAEKRIHAMPGTIEELVRDYEIQRLVFFLE